MCVLTYFHSPVKMFCSSRQHRSSRQQTPGPFACWRAHSEVQCGVSGKKLTEGSKIAGCWYHLTGLKKSVCLEVYNTQTIALLCNSVLPEL